MSNRKYTFNQDFFETIDSEEKSYWLGFLAADGCIRIQKNRYRITLKLAEKDKNHIEKFKNSIQSNHQIKPRVSNLGYIYFGLTLNSHKMFNDLLDKGLTPRKSLTLKPPTNVPKELIRHWIRGYFDGDGSIFKRHNRDTLVLSLLGTEEVLEFVLRESKVDLKVRSKKTSRAYFIQSSYKKALKFFDFIYKDSTIFLERKNLIYNNFLLKKAA
ncbi:MAG: hypothetical protein ACC656_10955 [Candidatus Heimdallarchaeota archaeon]